MVPDGPARLRVITAGDVGNVQSRLGSSGFDVVAVVDTEAQLVVAVTNSDPDAIVVEADLCPSLEHVRELAPDAALIVVGDHTPAGALGHIDRGVTGAILARLIQALAAGSLAAVAAVPGFTRAPTPARLGRLSEPARQAFAAGTAATVVVAAIGMTILGGASPEIRRPSPPPSEGPAAPTPAQPPSSVLPSDVSRVLSPAAREARPPVALEARQAVGGRPPTSAVETPPESAPESPPAGPPPGGAPAEHPPGHAKGWENKPPKHEDHGHHEGWTRGNGPKD